MGTKQKIGDILVGNGFIKHKPMLKITSDYEKDNSPHPPGYPIQHTSPSDNFPINK